VSGASPNEIRSVGYRGRRPESFSSQTLSVCTRRTERRIPVFNERPLEPAAALDPFATQRDRARAARRTHRPLTTGTRDRVTDRTLHSPSSSQPEPSADPRSVGDQRSPHRESLRAEIRPHSCRHQRDCPRAVFQTATVPLWRGARLIARAPWHRIARGDLSPCISNKPLGPISGDCCNQASAGIDRHRSKVCCTLDVLPTHHGNPSAAAPFSNPPFISPACPGPNRNLTARARRA
jgi:hypothetical protein